MRAASPRADSWLVTEAGARVVVDGYNVAKLGWPDQPLGEQRARLVDVLEDLAVRHHARVEVVFDGAHDGTVRQSRRRHVRVRFSPAGVLADDVIRGLVAAEPATNPIVVVTDDREVVDDVRALGANVVASAGLLAVARR
jgi:predicted RNA-binding protein with PIN domain